MPILYKVITAILALTGCVSLLMTGELNLLMTVSGLAILPGYYRFFRGMRPASKWAVGSLSLLTLVVFVTDSLIISGDVFLAVAHLTIAFQALKSFDLREPWDHLQVYFMSLLQLVIASELTLSMLFGVVFVFFMVLLVTAMVLSHFLKEGSLGRTAILKPVLHISFFTMLLTVMVFVLVPRTPHRFLGRSHVRTIKTSGFSDKVDLDSFGNLKLDPTVVMRIELDRDVPMPYWRGMTLDYFDGRSWRITREDKSRVQISGDSYRLGSCGKDNLVEQKVYMEPIDSDMIFGLSRVCTVKVEGFSLLSAYGNALYLRGKASRRAKYSIFSAVGESYEGLADQRNLQLPRGTDRIRALAGKITAGAVSDLQRAGLIESYLRKNYTYSLKTSEPPAGVGPIEDFIFNTKKGYCEHYASAMIIMLRSLGLPSRMVTGFYGGEKNEYGGYLIIRQSDAHSWVEALIGGRWRRFDPTPSVPFTRPTALALLMDSLQMNWARYVVGFSFADQMEILRSLTLPFRLERPSGPVLVDTNILLYLAISAALLLIVLLFFMFRRRNRKFGYVTERYLAFRKLLRKKGLSMRQSMSQADIKRATLHMGISEDIDEFLRMYEEHRFGHREMLPEDRKRYEMMLGKIKKKL